MTLFKKVKLSGELWQLHPVDVVLQPHDRPHMALGGFTPKQNSAKAA